MGAQRGLRDTIARKQSISHTQPQIKEPNAGLYARKYDLEIRPLEIFIHNILNITHTTNQQNQTRHQWKITQAKYIILKAGLFAAL